MAFQAPTQYLYGFPARNKDLEHIFRTMPAIILCKDTKGKYLEVNDMCVHITGNKSDSDLVGKTDPFIWGEQSGSSIQHDQEIIFSGKSKSFIEYGRIYTGDMISCVSYKTPLLDRSGSIIGVLGMAFPLEESNVMLPLLEKKGFVIDSTIINPTFGKVGNQIYELTKRQLDCLYYLVKGMTLKQIASELNISPRTVEHRIDNVKNKLGCFSRSELIAKALQLPAIKKRLLSL